MWISPKCRDQKCIFAKKKKNPKRVWIFSKTQPEPRPDLVIYIVTKIPSYIYIYIYIVKNPKLFYSSPHFSSHLRFSSLQLNLTHTISSFTHCLTRLPLLLHLSALSLTRPQAHKLPPPHSSLLSQLHFVLAVTDLALSHCPLPLSSSSPMATSVIRPHSTSFSIFFLVKFALIMWVCVCVYDFWKGKMKIIDLKFVFGLWFWKGKS